jgi:hypothetical protein
MAVANTLAYTNTSIITAVKKLYSRGPTIYLQPKEKLI